MWSGSTAMCLNIWFSTRGAVLGCCGSDLGEFLRNRPCGLQPSSALPRALCLMILWDLRTQRSSLQPPWHIFLPWWINTLSSHEPKWIPPPLSYFCLVFCKSRATGSTRAKWQWADGARRNWLDIKSWEASWSFSISYYCFRDMMRE